MSDCSNTIIELKCISQLFLRDGDVSTQILLFMWLLTVISFAHANEIPQSVVDECTTNSKTYHMSQIRSSSGTTRDQKRAAVLKALGISTSNPSLSTHNFTGQWFYERESGDAVYTGYKIRSHYLSVAVVYADEGLVTLLCDSLNMKQGERSIHKKAPLWKGTLESNLRIELGKVAVISNSTSPSIESLNQLLSQGLISQEEYDTILTRIESTGPI